MKLYLVSGAHHEVPNLRSSAHLTPASADAAALAMVNMIRDDAPRDGMDWDDTCALGPLPAGADWRAGLKEAQRCIVSFEKKIELKGPHRVTEDHNDLVRASRANVEIVELEIEGVPPASDALQSLLDAGEGVADLLESALPVHIYDDDEPADNVYRAALAEYATAAALARAAAIWQGISFQPINYAAIQGFAGPGAPELMHESPPCRPWSSPAGPDKRFSDLLKPPPEASPVHVVIGCYGGMVQWSYADRGGAKLTIIDFDVDSHRDFNLTLVVADDGTSAPANVVTEDVETNPDYVERLMEPVPCDGKGYVYGDDEEDQAEDPAKWLVTADIGILGPEGGTTTYSGFFPDADFPQLLAMASATIRRRFEPDAIKFFNLTTVPPKPASEKGGAA